MQNQRVFDPFAFAWKLIVEYSNFFIDEDFVIFMNDKISFLSRIDEGLVGVIENFERDSGYTGKVLERVGADLSEISNVDFSGGLSSDKEGEFLRCKFIAQRIMNHYTAERRKIFSDFNELQSREDVDESELFVLKDVYEILEDRTYLLKTVYGAVKPSNFELSL